MGADEKPASSWEALLAPESIRLTETATDRDEAVRLVGRVLVEAGAVRESYIEAMLGREHSVTTYVGEGVAMPHGRLASAENVVRDAICLVRFPDGVDWGGHTVTIAVGIASGDSGHIALLSRLAAVLLAPAATDRLRDARSADEVYDVLAGASGGPD